MATDNPLRHAYGAPPPRAGEDLSKAQTNAIKRQATMKASDLRSMLRGMAEAKGFIERNEHSGHVVHAPADGDLADGIGSTDPEDNPDADQVNDSSTSHPNL